MQEEEPQQKGISVSEFYALEDSLAAAAGTEKLASEFQTVVDRLKQQLLLVIEGKVSRIVRIITRQSIM